MADSAVADPEGVAKIPLPAPPPLPFKYPMKIKKIGLNETKLFHFHGIIKENKIKSAKGTPTPL